MPTNITVNIDLYHVLIWILVGLVAGFLAGRVTGSRMGLIGDVLVGILGAVIGNLLAQVFNFHFVIQGHPTLTQMAIAFVGALLLLIVLRVLGMGRGRRRAY